MSAVAADPLALVLGSPEETRFEWDGRELVPMSPPEPDHGRSILFLAAIMDSYAQERGGGRVFPDGIALHLGETIRIPDVAFFRTESLGRIRRTHAEGGADLVVEIVSPESRGRDRGDKFYEYERAGVEEYWIVDPIRRQAEFYRLVEGVYLPVLPDAGGRVYASTLPGFFVRVEWLWSAPKPLDAQRELGLL